jgi:hypothetical protein
LFIWGLATLAEHLAIIGLDVAVRQHAGAENAECAQLLLGRRLLSGTEALQTLAVKTVGKNAVSWRVFQR